MINPVTQQPMTVKPRCRQARRDKCRHCTDGTHCNIRMFSGHRCECHFATRKKAIYSLAALASKSRYNSKKQIIEVFY